MILFLKKNKDGKKPPKSTVPCTAQELSLIHICVDRISSQQHRKGHVLPDAGRYAIQR